MSGTLLDRYEAERAARLNRDAERAIAARPPSPQAGSATPAEVNSPRNYKPPVTAGIPGFEEAAKESAKAGGLEAQANSATNPAGEASAEAGAAAVGAVEKGGAAVNKAIKSAFSWTEAIAHFFNKLLEASTWLRVLKFILGAVLIIVAIILFTHAAGASGGQEVSGAKQAGAIGAAVGSPLSLVASQVGAGAQKAASAQHRRTTRASPSHRKAVQAGQARERARKPETDRRGKPLAGGAATARERRRVKERAQLLGMRALA
jgi:hypothetical protein